MQEQASTTANTSLANINHSLQVVKLEPTQAFWPGQGAG